MTVECIDDLSQSETVFNKLNETIWWTATSVLKITVVAILTIGGLAVIFNNHASELLTIITNGVGELAHALSIITILFGVCKGLTDVFGHSQCISKEINAQKLVVVDP